MSAQGMNKLRLRLPAPRIEQLLPLACLLSAGVLFASEFMTAFEFTPPDGQPLAEQSAGDRHGYALAVVAVFAFVATFAAVTAGSKPAAVAVGVAGVIALLVFLIVDLPDAGTVGTFEDAHQSFFDAEAVPGAGFWLGLAGALGLAVSGIALATLSSEQLAGLRPASRAGPGSADEERDGSEHGVSVASPNPGRGRREGGRGGRSDLEPPGHADGSEEGPVTRASSSTAARHQR